MAIKKSNLVVLGVAAHPDDLDAMAGGTFAKWAKSGAKCYYLICTDGGRGSYDPKLSGKNLVAARKKEQENAGKILGLKGVYFLDYKDTELTVDRKLKGDIVYYIRKLKPDIVVTTNPSFIYSPNGYINHSDHRAAGLATIDAIYPLARNAFSFEEFGKEGLKPHSVKAIYLISYGPDSNEIVDISSTIDLKMEAIKQHKSQMLSKNGEFLKKMNAMVGKKFKYKYAESFVKIEFNR
jgi:LmbE family N-acetylglucosaminyl deacetylase